MFGSVSVRSNTSTWMLLAIHLPDIIPTLTSVAVSDGWSVRRDHTVMLLYTGYFIIYERSSGVGAAPPRLSVLYERFRSSSEHGYRRKRLVSSCFAVTLTNVTVICCWTSANGPEISSTFLGPFQHYDIKGKSDSMYVLCYLQHLE